MVGTTSCAKSNALGATWLAGIVLATSAAGQAPGPARRHVPNDPSFAQQWPLDNHGQGGGTVDADVDAPEAWAITRGAPAILIAILDDAVQLDHPDLAPNIASAGRDFRAHPPDRKSTRLNSSHSQISYAVFCLKKKKKKKKKKT